MRPGAEVLDIGVGEPLLAVERVTYDRDGVAVEFGRDLFRGDRTRVLVWVEPGPGDVSQVLAESVGSTSLGRPVHDHVRALG